MQSLGHHSTSFFLSQVSFLPKRPVASTSCPTHTQTNTQRRRVGCVRVFGQDVSEVEQQSGHGTVRWKSLEIPSLPSAQLLHRWLLSLS